MDQNFEAVLQQLEADTGKDRAALIEAIRNGIETEAMKNIRHASDVTVEVDLDTLEFSFFEIRTVTEQVEDHAKEVSLQQALELDSSVVVGSHLKVPNQSGEMDRIAAQSAKRVIIQFIRDTKQF